MRSRLGNRSNLAEIIALRKESDRHETQNAKKHAEVFAADGLVRGHLPTSLVIEHQVELLERWKEIHE